MFEEDTSEFIKRSSIGIHAVSPDGFIKYANQYELETLGYNEDEYVGHHVSEFQINKPCLADMMAKLSHFEPLQNYPAMVQGKHGIKYILYNSNVYERNGEFIHTRCFGTEVSKEVYELMLKKFDLPPP